MRAEIEKASTDDLYQHLAGTLVTIMLYFYPKILHKQFTDFGFKVMYKITMRKTKNSQAENAFNNLNQQTLQHRIQKPIS